MIVVVRKPRAVLGVAVLVVTGCGGAAEPAAIDPAVTTTASTILTTIVELPTTTLEPKPTDVVEHRDGYDVLRNRGFLYEVPSAPEFGGFELHMKYSKYVYGLAEVEAGEELTQETLFRNLLWTFANQHPEFIKEDGKPDVDAYRSYLSDNDWIDTVYLPKNIHKDRNDSHNPPVVASDPVELDFKKSFVIGNSNLLSIDGFSVDNPNLYTPATADNGFEVFGINKDSQLYYGLYETDVASGVAKELRMIPPFEDFPIAARLGEILSVTSRITSPEDNPQLNWILPTLYFYGPALPTPLASPAPYAVMDIYDFRGRNEDKKGITNEIFQPITK